MIFGELLEKLTDNKLAVGIGAVWTEMGAEIPALADQTWAKIPHDGFLIDPGKLADLDFPEGKSLHYEPRQPVGAKG